MNRSCVCSALLCVTMCVLQPAAWADRQQSSISASDARTLMKTAHTTADYRQLAAYFRQQESVYRAKAADEKVEVDRRAQVNAALYQKYPRPVDTARNLYESYVTTADGDAKQAERYEALAAGPAAR